MANKKTITKKVTKKIPAKKATKKVTTKKVVKKTTPKKAVQSGRVATPEEQPMTSAETHYLEMARLAAFPYLDAELPDNWLRLTDMEKLKFVEDHRWEAFKKYQAHAVMHLMVEFVHKLNLKVIVRARAVEVINCI